MMWITHGRDRTRRWAGGLAALGILVWLAASVPAAAQEDEEIKAAKEQVHALLREAEKHAKAGWERAAREAREKAERIEQRIARFQERHRRAGHERLARLHQALEGLEHSMVALGELEWHKAREMLERIANEVRQDIRSVEGRAHVDRERQAARNQIEVLKLARHAMLQAEKPDAADLLHLAIRAREVGLEGRRDEEAREIRQRAPKRQQIIELLVYAEGIYREFGATEKANQLSCLTEELWPKREQRRRRESGERERARHGERERDVAAHDIEVMKTALAALREAGREDAAELMEYAIQARVIKREGIKGAEADIVRERAPSLGGQIELLGLATELWQEFGYQDKAEAVAALGQRLRREWARDRERDQERRHREQDEHALHERHEEALHRIDVMQERITDLARALHEIAEELQELKDTYRHEYGAAP